MALWKTPLQRAFVVLNTRMTKADLVEQFSLAHLRSLFAKSDQAVAASGYDDCIHCMKIDQRHYEEVYPEFEFKIVEREVTITKVGRQGEWMIIHAFDVQPRSRTA